MLTLLFGASLYGQSIALGLFMGGLAIGSKVIAAHLPKARLPGRWYAVLEGLIGLFGAASIFLLPLCDKLEGIHPHFNPVTAFLIACLFILPPTIFMGGTFPALFKTLESLGPSASRSLSNLSNLYTINTLGALAGIAYANYYGIPSLGMKNTLLLSALLNLDIFIICWIFVKTRSRPADKTAPLCTSVPVKPLLAIGISGFLTMLYEISWSRALFFSLGSSTYTFSLVIFSFILGLSLGAFWIKSKEKKEKENLKILFCDLQLKSLFFAAIFIFISSKLPLFSGYLFEYFQGVFWKIHGVEVLLLILLISPAAFFIGAAFPLTILFMAESSRPPSEKTVGLAYSINTLGSIAGSFATGFILIPLFGPFNLIWGALIGHTLSLLLIHPFPRKSLFSGLGVILSAVILFLLVQFHTYSERDLLSGGFSKIYSSSGDHVPGYLARNKAFPKAMALKQNSPKEKPPEIIWARNGILSHVAVGQSDHFHNLILNGKTDASVGDFLLTDMPTQTLLAFIPLVLSPDPQKALVVGYGSGVTAGTLGKQVPQVDCLEIEENVIRASHFFREFNLNAQENPNVRIHLCDARKFIRTTRTRYDLISAEPSNLWVSGVAHLFTRDYFRECREILNEKGVMIQWIHLYKLSLSDFKTALKSFTSVFPGYEIYGSFNLSDLFFVGYKNKIPKPEAAHFQKILEGFAYRDSLKGIQIDSFDSLQKFQILPSPEFPDTLKEVSFHTDDKPVLEYSAPKSMFLTQMKEIFEYLGE